MTEEKFVTSDQGDIVSLSEFIGLDPLYSSAHRYSSGRVRISAAFRNEFLVESDLRTCELRFTKIIGNGSYVLEVVNPNSERLCGE